MSTPYTTESQPGGITRVTVCKNGAPVASKRVKWQPISGVFHSQDGQSFKSLDDVAEGMKWATL